MDRITTILKFQWRAYWRRFRGSGNLRANNAGVIVLVGALGTIRFFQQLPIAAAQLSRGETARYEMLLLLVFLAWMVPVIGESRRSIAGRSLLQLPLTSFELFAIRVGSVFCSPLSWMIAVLSLALIFPIAMIAHPVLGVIGLAVFLLFGLFVSLTIMQVLQDALVRRLAFVVLFVVSFAGGLIWIGKQAQVAASLRSLTPDRLAVAAATSPTPFRAVGVTVYLFAIEDSAKDTAAGWKIAAVLVLSLMLYLFSLPRAARALETGREDVRRALL